MDHGSRISKLVDSFDELGIDSLYVSNLVNVRYLCGFTGSNGSLLIRPDGAHFFTDGRYTTQSAQQVKEAQVEIYMAPTKLTSLVQEKATKLGLKSVGFEAGTVTQAAFGELKDGFEGELVPTSGLVEKLRRVKEPDELKRIQQAARLADAGLTYILDRAEVGKTEQELALDLEVFMRKNGAEAVSFNLIVASAERSALPHAVPTTNEIEKGRYLLFDLGCIFEGYCSDITRTVVIGPADDRHREIYDLVLRANLAGLDAVRSGAVGEDIDRASRAVIEDAGHGAAFSHGLGHGVGLEVHEQPSLRPGSEDVLQRGEVVTVEPGIYLEGWGGVRIEDLVVVTEGEPDILSQFDKSLIIL
jgi:Xaa-Pro aminopeptidase